MIHIKNKNCSIYLDQSRTFAQVQIVWNKILIVFLGWFSSPAPLCSCPPSDSVISGVRNHTLLGAPVCGGGGQKVESHGGSLP